MDGKDLVETGDFKDIFYSGRQAAERQTAFESPARLVVFDERRQPRRINVGNPGKIDDQTRAFGFALGLEKLPEFWGRLEIYLTDEIYHRHAVDCSFFGFHSAE